MHLNLLPTRRNKIYIASYDAFYVRASQSYLAICRTERFSLSILAYIAFEIFIQVDIFLNS